ncbi:MAG: FUSC family protein [Microbacteriaceae bacterium]|nr:FUSC family protein [Microbacteriaceae bacterium]
MRRFIAAFRAARRPPLLQVAKTALAVAASWWLAVALLGSAMPIFAAIAALLVVAPSVNQSFAKGIERTIGVVIGVVIALGVDTALGGGHWFVLLAIGFAMLVGWLLKLTPGTANQIAISAMLVLALGATSEHYATERILETLIGAVVGVVVNAALVPPLLVEPAREQLQRLGSEVSATLQRLAEALVRPQTDAELTALLLEARLLRPMQARAAERIREGVESLMLNPRGRRHREALDEMQTLLDDKLGPIVTQAIGMTRAFYDQYDHEVHLEPMAPAIAEQFERAAHDVRLAVHLAEVDPAPMTSAIPALTAPLELAPPTSAHWVLFGSLMEDLRRIRVELLDGDDDPDGTARGIV